MNVLALIPESSIQATRIVEALARLGASGAPEVVRSVGALAERLNGLSAEPRLVMVYVEGREVLSSLLILRPRLLDLPLVLVLAEDDEQTVGLCHSFRPRVVLHAEEAEADLPALLGRLASSKSAYSRQPSQAVVEESEDLN